MYIYIYGEGKAQESAIIIHTNPTKSLVYNEIPTHNNLHCLAIGWGMHKIHKKLFLKLITRVMSLQAGEDP